VSKRYQVFVSSTYADLKQERQKVMQTLMEMDCIPSGMELFPAADEEQWEFIKKVIDDCDYYLVIIGGKYGSTIAEGISYTEKEYDYAIAKGMKVIALLRDNMDEIPAGKTESDPQLRQRLIAFREEVAKNRLVKFWRTAEELPGLVALSLQKTIKAYPAVGWVRGDRASSEDLLLELNTLRKENERLKQTVEELGGRTKTQRADIASMDERFAVKGGFNDDREPLAWSTTVSWRKIFAAIAPFLQQSPNDHEVGFRLMALYNGPKERSSHAYIKHATLETIRIQFAALGLIDVKYSRSSQNQVQSVWSLTPKGEAFMFDVHTVKSKLRVPKTESTASTNQEQN
jgi:hypothetical protein